MHILRDLPIKTLICVFITLFFVSCGQDVVDEVPVPLPDDELNLQDPSTRECSPEQSLNPITGECVDPPDEEDDPNQTSPGLNQDEQPSDPDENQAGGDDDPCGFGSIIGQACGTSGAHLPAAQVTVTGVDCYGQPFDRMTTTDGAGQFHFDNIPAGHHELFIQSGSFSSERNVGVRDGQTTSLMSEAEKLCISGDVNIMSLQGTWDDVGGLLDNLELEYDSISSIADGISLMSDPASLSHYDIIFIECWYSLSSLRSQAGSSFDQLMMNLRNYVLQGGSPGREPLHLGPHLELYGGHLPRARHLQRKR